MSDSSISDSEGHESWSEWVDNEELEVICPISGKTFRSVQDCLNNMKTEYQFDLNGFLDGAFKDENEKLYGKIKLINYMRRQSEKNPDLKNTNKYVIEGDEWKNDEYLTPVLEDDPLLYDDFGDDNESSGNEQEIDLLNTTDEDLKNMSREQLENFTRNLLRISREMKSAYINNIEKMKALNLKLLDENDDSE